MSNVTHPFGPIEQFRQRDRVLPIATLIALLEERMEEITPSEIKQLKKLSEELETNVATTTD